jgi:hypothetical protein
MDVNMRRLSERDVFCQIILDYIKRIKDYFKLNYKRILSPKLLQYPPIANAVPAN